MYTVVLVIHLIVCFFLIFIILVQSSKGAEMGAAFGGSSQTLFGSRGAATFMNKLTTTAAIVFMISSLVLAILSVRRGSVMSSIIVDQPAAQVEDQPAAPGQGEFQDTAAVPAKKAE
ncbi:protein-export membrane protein SecG [bacterium BMS3Abin09]|nr:protein-export membrane protein SecG [bacterium BMS3Abin09]HDH34551.1 preprotein translocase subunit SecG [Nitrospirota bacterium]